MKSANKLIFTGGLLLAWGCGRDVGKKSSVPPPPPQSSALAQTRGPDANSSGEIRPGPVQEHTVTLERIRRRVIHKKSDGTQISDKIEDIKSPTYRFSFKPMETLSGPVLGVKLKNRRNCASVTIKKNALEIPSNWIH